MSPQELALAIEHLGEGKHNIREIENQVIKDRHDAKRTATKKRKKKNIQKTV